MFPSALAIPAILFLTFIFLLSTSMHFTKRQQDGRKRPPGPPSIPIIGNLHMLGELPHRSLQLLAQKYGPIMSLKLGQIPAIVVSSAEAAELFLKTHDAVFASRPKIQAVDPLCRGTRGLAFAEYGPYWRYVRKVGTLHLLSASRVKMLAPLRSEEVGLMVKSLKSVAAAREVVNLSEVVGGLIENIIYRMILGCAKDDKFNLKEIIEEAMSLAGQFNLVDYVPWLGIFDLQGLTRKLRRNVKALDVVLEKIVTEHEQAATREQNVQHNMDFIHIMLSLISQPTDLHDDQNHLVDREHLKAIVADMIFAATDTSVIVIDWALSELLRQPRVMKILQNELQNVVGMSRMVDEADLAKLSYLDIVIKETLRLHPPAPLLVPRESMKDVIVNGYYIREKSRIMINAWAIGRDPKVWSDDASMFHPERFIDNNLDIQGHNYEFLPFGSGRRRCPGMQMGMTTVKLVVAQLVHCFSWELPWGMCPSDLDMNEKFGLTVSKMKHLHAVPTYKLVTSFEE